MITVPHPWIDIFIFTMYIRLFANITILVLSLVAIYYIDTAKIREPAVIFTDYNLKGAAFFFALFTLATVWGLVSHAYVEYDWDNIIIAVTITIGAIVFAWTKVRFIVWLLGIWIPPVPCKEDES